MTLSNATQGVVFPRKRVSFGGYLSEKRGLVISGGAFLKCAGTNVKEAYKGMVRPILEYGSSVWDPHPDKLQKELEKVQNRAARFVTRNYDYETGSMTGILGQLKWESLKKRRKDNTHIAVFLFSILGMGAGPFELGKSAPKNSKLGKVETCLKA